MRVGSIVEYARCHDMDNGMKPTILVVEDEAMLLLTAVCFLEDAGFQCLEAANAEEGSQLLNSHPEIVALFTDIEMNGSRNGLDLAQEAHALRPDIGVVIASGRLCPLADELPAGSVFISKPYRPEAIARTLQGLMAA
jgi:CheY-like chemotaxis protein